MKKLFTIFASVLVAGSTMAGTLSADFLAGNGTGITGLAVGQISGAVGTNDLTGHTTNAAIHVSTGDRTNWNGKASLSDVAAAGYITNAGASGTFDHTALTNQQGNVNLLHIVPNQDFVWSHLDTTNAILTNLLVTGTMIPDITSGTFTQGVGIVGGWYYWDNSDVSMRFSAPPDFHNTYLISTISDGIRLWSNAVAGNPEGTYYPYGSAATGIVTVSKSYVYATTNTYRLGKSNDSLFLSRNGTNLWTCNGNSNNFFVPVFINGSTVLTNVLYGISDTTAFRGDWGLAASNLANEASTNAEAARQIATNAQAVANAALPKAGGILEGAVTGIVFTASSFAFTNGVTMYSGSKDGTNGMCFVDGTNSYWLLFK